jgi:hypothetical protein
MSDQRLIHTLRSAVEARRRALRFGWSRRPNHDDVTRALMACEQFVNSYPGASDALVRNWCRENSAHVMRVVLGGRDKVLQSLIA